MNTKIEDKGLVIQDVFEKILFDEELDYVFLENFVCAYSFFILKTNKDYKYNQTYLSSYFEDFINVREKLNEKKKIRDEVKKRMNGVLEKQIMRISIDQYWLLELNEDEVHSKFAGTINKERIMSNKCLVEVECISLDREKIIISEFVNLNDKEKMQQMRLDNIFEKLMKVLETEENKTWGY